MPITTTSLRRNRPHARGTSSPGQSLVEFALVLPVVMLVFMGIIQLGFLFGAQIGLINGVREAARYGSLSPTTDANASSNASAVVDHLRNVVLPNDVMGYSSSNLQSATATYCAYQNYGSSPTSYSVRLTITARYAHPLFIPLVGVFLDGFDGTNDSALAISSTERFRVENMPLNASEVTGMTACP